MVSEQLSILLMMINIVELAIRTPPPPIVAAVSTPEAPLYSQDTSPKHSIICLYHTDSIRFRLKHKRPTNYSSSLHIKQHDIAHMSKQLVQCMQ